MRERTLVHVAGPKGAGKTTFIESIVSTLGWFVLAARCVRDDSLRRSRETAPKAHPELRRYREAGATGAALFAFPEGDIGSDAFFVTHLMEDYSQAVAGGYEGVEHAQLVVVNIRSEAERQRGEQLVADVGRLRKDSALFDAILGFRGSRIPVTAVVANLADPRDAGTKKAVARVRRALRTRL